MTPRVSVVIPVRDEGANLLRLRDRITPAERIEFIAVADHPADGTQIPAGWHLRLNRLGPGPANAIRAGILTAAADVIVVMCADGSDDPAVLWDLVAHVQAGAAICAASRYLPGGARIGGPRVKAALSRLAGASLAWLARRPVTDPTNAYKAYDAAFLHRAGMESDKGFTLGLEMTAKAIRLGLTIAEIPVTWRDREHGRSHWKWAWLPAYLRWWWFALGPRVSDKEDA